MSNYNFKYLIDRINEAEFTKYPFRHLFIKDFFNKSHFDEIKSSFEIKSSVALDDKELINSIIAQGYEVIEFPGCVSDTDKYINWHQNLSEGEHHSACEGFGMVLRLKTPSSSIINEVYKFFGSEIFNSSIAQKLEIDFNKCSIDFGIQKYLDGYEISPHADIKQKAATYMININPIKNSEYENYHTHYLKFRKKYKYVQEYWRDNTDIDRAWVPWHWAKTIKTQKENNSLVLFSPHYCSLHAVKANYDHLNKQRTQIYGNLWYKNSSKNHTPQWEDLDFGSNFFQENIKYLKLHQKLKLKLKSIIDKL